MGVIDVDSKCDSDKPYCKHCEMVGHQTDNCHTWGKEQCIHCTKFNHTSDDCYFKNKLKPSKKEKKRENSCKHTKNEANAVESDHSYAAIEEVEEVGEVSLGGITFDPSEHGQYFNFDNENVTDYNVNDEHTLYYDWLANSVTTSHITNRCNTFVTYVPIQNTLITRVGGLQAQAKGCGDVNIIVSYKGKAYLIHLCDVLYVSRNQNNLFSLGY